MSESSLPRAGAEGEADPYPTSPQGWEEKAREFARARLWLYGIRALLSLFYAFAFWSLGWSRLLQTGLEQPALPGWLVVGLFLLAYEFISAVVFLPFSYYGGFILQHRFDLSRQTRRGWVSDWLKSTGLGAFFFVVGMGAFYLLLPAYPSDWWWILALVLSLVAILMTFVAPVLLLPIFYRRSPVEDGDLARRIQDLAARAGTRISRVSVIDMSRRTVAANAALTGIGRTRQVLLGDTMLQQFTPDEVETVVAHELGHHVHNDIWKGLALEVGGIWAGMFLLQFAVRPLFLAIGLGGIGDLANLPLLILLAEVASLGLMPVANAVSRRYESQADAFAARLSRKPEAYSSALYRLAKQNLAELWPPRWVELLLYTHPAIGRRMAAVRGQQPPNGEPG